MGCEARLNFNCPKGPEKLMVRGEGLGVGEVPEHTVSSINKAL